MKERLVISGTIPRWVSRLAKEYHTFQGDRHIKALRVWYRLSDRFKTPDWVLTRFVNQAGVPYSAVLDVSPDSEGKLYMTEFLSAPRDREERMLRQWRRIVEEEEEDA